MRGIDSVHGVIGLVVFRGGDDEGEVLLLGGERVVGLYGKYGRE